MPYAAFGFAAIAAFLRNRVSAKRWFTMPRAYAGSLLLGLLALLILEGMQ
jgi:hypothetical protein